MARTYLPYSHGRPDLHSYLSGYKGITEVPGGKAALVFACGPAGLVQEAKRAASEAGMEFHNETFEL